MSEDKKEKQILKPEISPDIIAAIKAEVMQEMRNEDVRRREEASARRKQEKEQHEKYIATMKESPDPWVEIEGWAETKDGVKIELEWNDAFVAYLREQGITGSDEDQVVQKWIILLMKDLSSDMSENPEYE